MRDGKHWQGSMKRGDLLDPLETQVDLVNTPKWILFSLVFCTTTTDIYLFEFNINMRCCKCKNLSAKKCRSQGSLGLAGIIPNTVYAPIHRPSLSHSISDSTRRPGVSHQRGRDCPQTHSLLSGKEITSRGLNRRLKLDFSEFI